MLVLPDPRARNDEQRRTGNRMRLPDAVFDGPSLLRVEFFEIGDGHGLRISGCRAGYWISFSFCSQPILRRRLAV